MTFRHTPATDAIIRQGYADGILVIDIAETLGVTRNVVIGRARRLGLTQSGRSEIGTARFWSDPDRVASCIANRRATISLRKIGARA
jgi:hypothetical protein